ncbi:MAG TPA: ATP-binding protein [Gammaproteobacteria bacterium]|nr:ATP-binding protein [Gammaproteobacteria bacterium]
MIPRHAEPRLKRLAEQFPAVLLLGARQCGKTTLVRHFVDGRYFDLERPSDLQVFAGDIEYALRQLKGPLILDEAQSLPALFPVLRSVVDEARRARGRFFLLGSVSPELVRNISETLAGRIGVLELTPFLYSELAGRRRATFETLWQRGGFPDALLARDAAQWLAWQEGYVRTFIERDVARHKLTLSSADVRRLMTMLAHSHGGLLNYSNLGRSLGYTYHTVQNLLDLLEGYFLVRRLPPYHVNLGKRLVKSPKAYIRDSGLLHYLLGIRDVDGLVTSPARGNSFEGFMIEQIIALENLHGSGSGFYFFRTHTGTEIDLLIDRGQSRIGFEFKAGLSTTPDDWKHLQAGVADEIIDRGLVVYNGTRAFAASDEVRVVPAKDLLTMAAGKW